MLRKDRVDQDREPDANRDPISGAPGAHPVGVGAGAAAGGAAGAGIGALGGPIGAGIGAVVGAVAGGLAGKAAGESVNPTAEDAYWRENYQDRDYVDGNARYEEYKPAYQYGWESCPDNCARGRSFGQVESELERDWPKHRGSSNLSWEKAKHATRDAWNRVERAIPGDADRDGR